MFKVHAFTWLNKNTGTCKKNCNNYVYCIYWNIFFFPVGHKCLYFWTSRKHTRYEHTECSPWTVECVRAFCVWGHGGDWWRRWEIPPVLYRRPEYFTSVEGLTLYLTRYFQWYIFTNNKYIIFRLKLILLLRHENLSN